MVFGAVVLVLGVVGVVGITVYLVRQRRMYAPTPPDLRRADDEDRDGYSLYEQGHDIATSFVERGGGGGA